MRMTRLASLAVTLLASAGVADAGTIFNFKAMAETSGTYGETAWNPLSLTGTGFTVDIVGIQGANTAFAYLDSGNAGLGVCGKLLSGKTTGPRNPKSSSNICDPSSDDNVTTAELLRFEFSHAVRIDTIWFNNNHDGDKSLLNNKIKIDGTDYTFTNGGSLVDSFTTTPFLVAANTPFDIAFIAESLGGDQFYISKMDVTAVPEPVAAAQLVGFGLVAVGLLRRRLTVR